MSMAQWAVTTGFYTEDQLEEAIYTEAVTTLPRPPLVAFWDYLTDHRHHFGKTNGSVSHLRDPMHRILHHIIARTICPRDLTREKVNLGDLFHLYCLLTGRRANLADSLAQFLAGAHHRKQAGALYGGSFVTYIARRLMFEPSIHEDLEEVIAPESFGKQNLLGMTIVGKFEPARLVSDIRALEPFEPEDIPAQIPDYRELGDGRPDPEHSPQPRHPLFAPPAPQQQPPQPQPQQQPEEQQQGGQPQPQPQPQQQQPEQHPQAPQHPQHVYSDMMPGMRVFAESVEARLGALETLVETRLDALETLAETRQADLERRRRRERDFQRATSTHILAALRLIAPTVQFPPDPAPPQDTDDDDDGDAGSTV